MKLLPLNFGMSFKAARIERNAGNYILDASRSHISDTFEKSQSTFDFEINRRQEEIEKLKSQKEKASEIENFMNGEKAASLLKQLPDGDVVNIISEPNKNEKRSLGFPIMLRYIPGSERSMTRLNNYNCELNTGISPYAPERKNVFKMTAQNQDGNIDEQGIIDWLTKLNEILQ